MHDTKRDIAGRLRELWRERRPSVIAALMLLVGLPVVISTALVLRPRDSVIVSQALNQAQAATQDGDYSDAYNRLKVTEGQATTKKQKIAFYSDLAAAAANAGKPGEAINYLNLKHQIEPSTAGPDAEMLAALYEQTGNTIDALAQYKLSLDFYRSLPKNPTNDARIESLQVIIKDLESISND